MTKYPQFQQVLIQEMIHSFFSNEQVCLKENSAVVHLDIINSFRESLKFSRYQFKMSSDAEQTGNEGNVNNTLFAFLKCSRNWTVPHEGYIASERSPNGVTDQHAANQPLTQTTNNTCHRQKFKPSGTVIVP